MIIAIDGPSGSGKSTVAKELAKRLGFACLDTGAMYRAVTYRGLQMGFDLASIADLDAPEAPQDVREALVKVANDEPIAFEYDEFGQPIKVEIGGQDVTRQIRTKEVDSTVSVVSACSDIRTALVAQQRVIGAASDTIIEGRDIGTVVFPNAELKVFLTASAEARAHRRVLQNAERGVGDTDEQATLELMKYRDKYDSSRANSPLSQAEDAILVDSTDMTFEEVVERIIELAQERM
ncbi:MAG: (d)CMP kinase [bacterium]|nr:(d)CMP kinase [bacterium]